MKLLRSTKNKITKYETGENVPSLEITEVVLVNHNIASNNYHQDSKDLYIFVPYICPYLYIFVYIILYILFRNKTFGQLLDISTNNF